MKFLTVKYLYLFPIADCHARGRMTYGLEREASFAGPWHVRNSQWEIE